MAEEPKVVVYHLAEREVHMVGDYVGVCWNTKKVRQQKSIIENGVTYHAEVKKVVREGRPYIDFLYLRKDEFAGEVYADKDSPVEGGISAKFARQIAAELLVAADYLEQQKGA